MTSLTHPQPLESHLRRAFGWTSFRANQRAVCQAAIGGRDVLLVMPTGSGKSLCYQLPAIVRGGTALVVSPLIALMDDQAAKLTAMGLAAGRIHSGLERAQSRQACIDYLNGKLSFLFIAPERLKVPGFPEMLAKRRPCLIAIDEAHCISQWGHDFRPDYRMLRPRLDALRPAPIMALTATATPRVQRDIVAQLGLVDAAQFIHGFRRHNLSVEVVNVSLPQRAEIAYELLSDPGRRPAIVYAPSRKSAEALAAELSRDMPAAAYHAGLEPAVRERTQSQFLLGRLEVIVATIAFGMGIDKPDVRTVIHTALPGSLEGYYQEIGRAGRDGLPSRTVLMHSFADQKMQDFFLTRDYPPEDALDEIFLALDGQFRHGEKIRESLKMEADVFERALDKLTSYGGASSSADGSLKRGHGDWRDAYAAQVDHRRSQAKTVLRFADGDQCRMAALVRHFGDIEDGQKPCGICDFCDPGNCAVQQFRAPTKKERAAVNGILAALREAQSLATGSLFRQLPATGLERNQLEEILSAMSRAGLVALEQASFEKDGKLICYRRASLIEAGREIDPKTPMNLSMKRSPGARKDEAASAGRLRPKPTKSRPRADLQDGELPPPARALEERLMAWRKAEAGTLGIPPYLILHNRTLRAIALGKPANLSQLTTIGGIGAGKAETYGAAILRLCSE